VRTDVRLEVDGNRITISPADITLLDGRRLRFRRPVITGLVNPQPSRT
jgi:hypothetical protein